MTWSTVSRAQGYYVTIGTSGGAYDVLASGELPASPASYAIPVTLPTGRTLYARIYTKLNGAYSAWNDITFTAVTPLDVAFTYPANGQTGVDTRKPFTWSTIVAATNYVVAVGTTAGAWDLVASGELPASQSSYNVATLPAGRTLYARIWSKVGGWYSRYSDITFTVAAPPALPALTVTANKIVANGQPFQSHGVNRDSLEWGQNNWTGCAGDGNFTDADFDNMNAWKVTAVRLPLSQANWLGRRCNAASYMQTVDAAIAKANAHGMYAIVELHWSDVSGRAPCDASCWSGQQPMPDADSLVFWQQVAARYKDRRA